MTRYRVEVGHQDSVKPGEIVGAIANEAGLEGRYIGRIDIQDDHSLVDLPEGMPKEIAQLLRRVRVRGKALKLRALDGKSDKPHKSGKSHAETKKREKKPHRKGKSKPERK